MRNLIRFRPAVVTKSTVVNLWCSGWDKSERVEMFSKIEKEQWKSKSCRDCFYMDRQQCLRFPSHDYKYPKVWFSDESNQFWMSACAEYKQDKKKI